MLRQVHLLGARAPKDLVLEAGRIAAVTNHSPGVGEGILLKQSLAFPGLINSHDHLELNNFPFSSTGRHPNYRNWAQDVQSNFQSAIEEVTAIPLPLRYTWGVIKNLVCGITTVVQHGAVVHGPWPISVLTPRSLHSVAFEPSWRRKILLGRSPVVIHLGEGVDVTARREVQQLIKSNVFKRKIVAVHGIALQKEEAKQLQALIWCPDSNRRLYGQTAKVNELRHHLLLLFGTDSTLSAHWDIWTHLRHARTTQMLKDESLLSALTTEPADCWGLSDCGRLAPGQAADLVVVRKKTADPWEAFFQTTPGDVLLVIKSGHPVLMDASLYQGQAGYWPAAVEGMVKYLAWDVPQLVEAMKTHTHDLGPVPITRYQP